MTKYECGHETEILILDSNALSVSAYLTWSETVGLEGDKSMCFNCWVDKRNLSSKQTIIEEDEIEKQKWLEWVDGEYKG